MVQCTDPETDLVVTSSEIPVGTAGVWTENTIRNSIPFLRDKVDVWHYNTGYHQNGFNLMMKFSGFNH